MKYNLTVGQKKLLNWIVVTSDASPHSHLILGESDNGYYLSDYQQSIDVDYFDIEQLRQQRLIQVDRPRVKILQWGIDAVKNNFDEQDKPQSNDETNPINFIPIFGAPATTTQYKADIFVMMPFRVELKHIYDNCMKPAVQSLNLTINRGDDFFTKHTIMTDVWSAIYYCRIVIADCTGKNANVFYELGMTHTVGKPVILLAQNEEDIPFDIRHFRRIIYSNTPEGLIKLSDELKSAIPKILDT